MRLIEYAKLPDRRRAEFPRLRAGTFIEAHKFGDSFQRL